MRFIRDKITKKKIRKIRLPGRKFSTAKFNEGELRSLLSFSPENKHQKLKKEIILLSSELKPVKKIASLLGCSPAYCYRVIRQWNRRGIIT